MSTLERILRAALAAKARRTRSGTSALVPPESADEVLLAAIWRDVLGLDAVGIDDGFFELGGTSLQLAQVGAKIFSQADADVPLATLFAASSLRAMASRVGAARSERTAERLVPTTHAAREVPATLAQIYYHRLYAPRHNRFLEVHRLDGSLDVPALQRAFTELVRRHEILRTTFSVRDGALVQVVHDHGDLTVEELDVEGEGALVEVAREEMERVIDIETLPLVACRLVRFAPGSHALFLAVPHVVLDDWSLDLLFKEMLALYEDPAAGGPPRLQYRDYASWQARTRGPADLAFWTRQLTTASAAALPTDRPRQGRIRGPHRSATARVPATVLGRIGEESARAGATLFMGLLAAFEVFVHDATKQECFIVRSPFANRDPVETEAIPGCFSHPLPFRADLSGNPSFRTVLGRVRDDVIRVHAHRPFPFDDEALWGELDQRANRVGFNFLVTDRTRSYGGMRGVEVSSLAHVWRSVVRNFLDVYFFLAVRRGDLDAVVFYNTDLFDADRITALLARFEEVVTRLVVRPDDPIGEVL